MERQTFDASYVQRLRDGDAGTQENFTRYFSELIACKLRARLRSPQMVEDIRQETFLRVFVTLRRNGLEHPERLGAFVLSGLLLGFIGFWGLPLLLDATVPYDRALFGNTMFVFVFWIFINVHHYFLDNVMWRRENPDTRKHLFGR